MPSTQKIEEALARPVNAIARFVAHVSPNVLTLIGLIGNVIACVVFASCGRKEYTATVTYEVYPNLMRIGGLVTLGAAIFDMLDGRVARMRGRESTFGAFLDSTMDRYSDMLLYMGLMILYARLDKTPLMVLVWVAAFGSFMTSYARARAESLIPRCGVGFMERPERIVALILGALTNRMPAVLWAIAVFSNLTALQRIVYTLVELRRGWPRQTEMRP
jgi:CDP-diacylglycerol--glycerol-3-phosphate 3-phosphatidyltransferase